MMKLKSIEGYLAEIRASVAFQSAGSVPENKEAQVIFIKNIVAAHFGIMPEDMESKLRPENIAWPRQVAMVMARECTHLPLTRIGELFGGRDHGTVLHAERRVRERCATEPHLNQLMTAFKIILAGQMTEQQNIGNGVDG